MPAKSTFEGFPRECVQFYVDVAKNNNKEWFAAHKSDYDRYVMAPARDFVYEMGKRLELITPNIVADPRVNKSIFRPYRDTRFSKDKTPYKTHLGIFFWAGGLAKMDCPGYYVHIEPPILMLGVGNHCFSKKLLGLYRDSVVDPTLGPALAQAVQAVQSKGNYEIGVEHYKKVPRGYDKEHPNARYLLYNGLTAAFTTDTLDALYSAKVLDVAFARFKDMSPMVEWLLTMLERADA